MSSQYDEWLKKVLNFDVSEIIRTAEQSATAVGQGQDAYFTKQTKRGGAVAQGSAGAAAGAGGCMGSDGIEYPELTPKVLEELQKTIAAQTSGIDNAAFTPLSSVNPILDQVGDFKYSGTAYSQKTPDGQIDVLTGSIEHSTGSTTAKGAIFQGKKGDQEATLGSFSYSDTKEGVQGSLTLGQAKTPGETDTFVQVEHKDGVFKEGDDIFAGQHTSGFVAKKEIDAMAKLDEMDPTLRKKLGLDKIVLQGDADVLSASKDQWISTKDGIGIGAQANLVEGSVTMGTQGTEKDETTRVGLSLGEGAAARVHWADKDGDGIPEFGVGVDVEFLSVDIKTEDPLRKAIEVGGGMFGQAASSLLGDGNLTNDAITSLTGQKPKDFYDEKRKQFQQGAQDISDAVDGAENKAKEAFDGMVDLAKKGIEQEVQLREDQMRQQAEALQQAGQVAGQYYDEATKKLSEVGQGIGQKAGEIWDGVTDVAQKGFDAEMQRRDEEIRRQAEGLQKAGEAAGQMYDQASQKVSEVSQGVSQAAQQVEQGVTQAAQAVEQKVEDAAQSVKDGVTSVIGSIFD